MRIRGLGRARRVWDRLTGNLSHRGVILMYHRIADAECDPWGLCVSPGNFAAHLDVLREHDCVIPPAKMAADFRRRKRLPTIAITFDDGYADNLYEARPLLEQASLPATIFMTSGNVGRTREFWWDELEKIFLQPGDLPETLHLQVDAQDHEWRLDGDASYRREQYDLHRRWRADLDPLPTMRQRLYGSIYELLQRLPGKIRDGVMDELVRWSGTPLEVRGTHRALRAEETRQLAKGDGIEIGAHTVNHQALSTQTVAVQREEIVTSRIQLEEITGQSVNSFSYPYGLHSVETVRIVREAGFQYACACLDQPVTQTSDPFCLPRMMVENWTREEFETRLDRWLNGSATQ